MMDDQGVFDGLIIMQDMGNGRYMFWVDCSSRDIVLWFWICEDFVGLLVAMKVCAQAVSVPCLMEDSSEPTISSPPAQFIETYIKEMKRKIRGISRVLGKMDFEGGHRFDNVYNDMAHLKKECGYLIAHTKTVLTRILADLEIKF